MSPPLIVCVDDDPEVARTIARKLRKEQYNPMSTTEPEEALEWVLERDVAVLVSDYEMPAMDGIQLAAKVRELRPTTVRIMLTAHATANTAMNSINKGGVFRFVPKPFDLEMLADAVREGIDHHRELAALESERLNVQRRGRTTRDLEARFPSLTAPVHAVDGAYLVRRNTNDVLAGLGLDALIALRRHH